MASSPDHPELRFVQASGFTPGRPDGPPLWLVVHDMEAGETLTRAESTADYFANPPDGRRVSAHYCCDANSLVQCVRLQDSAWTVGNRPGNNRGINYELAGFAAQTRAQWLDTFGRAMFAQIRPILRADAAKYGIPLERRTVADLQAWRKGITSHNDLRLAFGGTTHTDPGSNFPWDVFLQTMNENEEDPVAGTVVDLVNSRSTPSQISLNNFIETMWLRVPTNLEERLDSIDAQLAEIRTLIEAMPGATSHTHAASTSVGTSTPA